MIYMIFFPTNIKKLTTNRATNLLFNFSQISTFSNFKVKTMPGKNLKIYFGRSIRGGQKEEDARVFSMLVKELMKYGQVLTEKFGDDEAIQKEDAGRPKYKIVILFTKGLNRNQCCNC